MRVLIPLILLTACSSTVTSHTPSDDIPSDVTMLVEPDVEDAAQIDSQSSDSADVAPDPDVADELDTQAPDDVPAEDTAGAETTQADTGLPDAAMDVSTPEDAVTPPSALDTLLAALREDLPTALLAQANSGGWPAPLEGGLLVVSTSPTLNLVAGEHDDWAGTPMAVDDGFAWAVLPLEPGSRYKFTDLETFAADPWSRAYEWDEFGLMSMVAPTTAHRERFFDVTDGTAIPRIVRAWVPAVSATHILYAHDGQNLFNPNATWGGWKIDEALATNTVLASIMVVGIDNTEARFTEYTHVADNLGNGPVGGGSSAYLAFVKSTVRPLIAQTYGEPATTGIMGSSLGGLVSLHAGLIQSADWDFVASMSATLGWGSLAADAVGPTLLEQYADAGIQTAVLYLDSGGSGSCLNSDNDGLNDDGNANDNYCENTQFHEQLQTMGYTDGIDLHYEWDEGAPHNEAAWAGRVATPLTIFAGL